MDSRTTLLGKLSCRNSNIFKIFLKTVSFLKKGMTVYNILADQWGSLNQLWHGNPQETLE